MKKAKLKKELMITRIGFKAANDHIDRINADRDQLSKDADELRSEVNDLKTTIVELARTFSLSEINL